MLIIGNPLLINILKFVCGYNSFLYLCITELVINPTGGGPGGGRVDSTALYIYIYPPVCCGIRNRLYILLKIIVSKPPILL